MDRRHPVLVAQWAGNCVDVPQQVDVQMWQDMDQVWIDRMGDHA